LTQDEFCKEKINQSDKEKFKKAFSKWLEHQKFNLFSLKFLQMSKLLCKVLKFYWGKCPNAPPDCVPALFDTVVKSLNYFMLSAATRMN